MKTPTNSFFGLMRIIIKSYPNFLVIISLCLILFVTWMSGLVTTCFAQSPWTRKTNMPISSNAQSSCVLDGKIYALGGQDAKNKLQVFDPVSNTWTFRANMHVERMHLSSCVFNDKILAIGGTETFYKYPKTAIEEYDPVSNTWTYIADMPTARIDHTSSLVNGKIYIIGGGDDDYVCIPEVDVFDPMTNEWTTAADMLTPRMCLEAVVLNNKIYAIGGMEGLLKGEIGETTMEMYDPATDTWTTKAGMTIKRKYFTASVVNGKIYVIGGAGGYCGPLIASVEEYDPETDSWREVADFPENLAGGSAASLDSKIFVSGGHVKACPAIPTYFMYEYDPHRDLFPLIEKTEVDKNYAKPGIDSVLITTKMWDTTGITLMVEIEAPNQTPVDSLQLFDDGAHNDGNAGDSLFANVWQVSSEEQNYYVDLKVTRIDVDTVIHMLNNMATFTTIGPVNFESYTFTGDDTIPNPDDQVKLKITLRNNGSTATATSVNAELVSPDTLVSVLSPARNFGNIAAGESQTYAGYFTIEISEECPVNTQIPIIINITGNKYIYPSDTFFISVQRPVNIKDIIDPVTRIYPNPTDNILNIEISNIEKQGLEIEIHDITNKVIYQKEFKIVNARFSEQLDLSGYTKGIYLVKVRQANTVYVEKVVLR